MDNVQNVNTCINIPSSQMFKSYQQMKELTMLNAGTSHIDELPCRNEAIPHTAHGDNFTYYVL
jgi:hypothetical protein